VSPVQQAHDCHGDPQRVPNPPRDGSRPAKPGGYPHDHQFAALFTAQQRALLRVLSLPHVFQLAGRTLVGVSPHDVVLESGTHRLLRYRRDTPARHAEPVLLCYALINRPYILDLQPDKSVVRQYLEQGFEVYLIDWGVPRSEDRGLSVQDYVCGFLRDAVAAILRRHERQDLHLLGYCMGGTMATMFTAFDPAPVKTLTLLAAPIDFSGRESLLTLWTQKEYFDVDAFLEAYGNCPEWFLQMCFLWLKPVQNLVEKGIALAEQLDDRRFVTNHFAMELWINDNIPIAGATFREFVKDLYQENQLVKGAFRLRGQPADLRRITCPMLLLTANNDHLVPPQATEGIRPYVGARDIHSMSVAAGHVGLVVGSKAQKTMWPQATRWLADRSTSAEQGHATTIGGS
jgi:polyhydroxyalkanoate synthase subunit PhaC